MEDLGEDGKRKHNKNIFYLKFSIKASNKIK